MMRSRVKVTIMAAAVVALSAFTLKTAIGADSDKPAMMRHGRGAPGELWQKAAELQKSLTAEQKARLLSNSDSAMPGRGGECKGGPKGMHGHDPLSKILTPEQKSAVDAIRESYRTKFEALGTARRNNTITDDQFRTQTEALHTAMKGEIDAKLTDEQKAALAQMAPPDGGPRRGPGAPDGRMGGAPPPSPEDHRAAEADAMSTALGLSSEQRTAVEKLFEQTHTETQALMEKLRADGVDPKTARPQMEALHQKHLAALDQILDDRQMEIVRIHDALIHRGGPGGCHGGKCPKAPDQGTQSQPPTSSGSTIK